MINIEIKARYADLDKGRLIARDIGAAFEGTDNQVDTYFRTPNGLLKLRETSLGEDHLIYYEREKTRDPKVSDYDIYPVRDATALKKILRAALTVLVEVRKVRDIFILDNTRIHLDRVEGLGTFIEFEAVMNAGQPHASGEKKVRELLKLFEVPQDALIGGSYSDLLLKKE